MNLCPACRSKDIHRSKSRNALERWRKEHSDKRLFRCHKCGWRGWGIPLGSDYHPPVEENAVDVEQIRFDVESPDRDTKDR